MKKVLQTLVLFIMLSPGNLMAQVGIGTTSPNSSAQLDISSNNKGLLIPRMSSTQRRTISNPAQGLMVFDNDSAYFFYYDGNSWRGINYSTKVRGPWYEDYGAIMLSNFNDSVGIGKRPGYRLDVNGAINADSLMFQGETVVNTKGSYGTSILLGAGAGSHGSGAGNVLAGYQAGYYTNGSGNIMEGYQAGYNNSIGYYNIFSGYQAGYNNTYGNTNTIIGCQAGYSNTTGSHNVFMGEGTGYSNSTGSYNLFLGHLSGYSNTTGDFNLFVGSGAGYSNSTGDYNLFMGLDAGYSNSTGQGNIFTGTGAGYSNSTGSYNIFNGYQAGNNNTTGSYNIFTGKQAGSSNTTGNYNVFTGYQAGYANATGSGNTYNGYYSGGNSYYGADASNNTFFGYYSGYNNTSNSNTFVGSMAGLNGGGGRNTAIGDSADISYNATNATAIGFNAMVTQSNSIVLGATGAYQVNVGIGTKSPEFRLDVEGGPVNADSFMLRTITALSAKGSENIYVGQGAGALCTTMSDYNAFLGYQSGYYSTGSRNTFIGEQAGYTTSGRENTFIGMQSGYSNTTGRENTFIGAQAGNANTTGTNNVYSGYAAGTLNTTGSYNVFNGDEAGLFSYGGSYNVLTGASAGYNNIGDYNIYTGYQAGYKSTTGNNNCFFGNQAGYNNSGGNYNIFMGYNAGINNSGDNNIFTGNRTGYYNTSGNNNCFLGNQAGYANTTGAYNDFIGNNAGAGNGTGNYNVFNGYYAGYSNTSGSGNVFEGRNAGYYNYTNNDNTAIGNYAGAKSNGSMNTFLGDSADVSGSNISNATAIGYYATVGQSNSIVLGATGSNQPNVGVGTSRPDLSALMELKSTNQGFLMPRMSSAYRNAISSPAQGLMIFDTDSGYMFFYNGGWKGVKSSAAVLDYWARSGTNTTLNNSGDKLGIGKTPMYKVDVSGPVNADSLMLGGYTILNAPNTHCLLLGQGAGISFSGQLTNATAIGYNAKVGQNNSIVLGNGSANVGVGTSTPASTAIMELQSTTQGFLMPRMSSSNRTSISFPAKGLMVFDTDSGYVFYYNTGWKSLKNINPVTYSAGTGLTLSGTSFSAQNTTALWNANKLQGKNISPTAPSSNQVLKWNSGLSEWTPATDTTISQWTTSGSDIYYSSGKVGIGITSPAKHLHVYGSGDQEIAIQSSDAGARQWTLQSNGTSAVNATFQIVDRTAGASRFGIDNSGNVGIGKTNPYHGLDVKHGISTDSSMRFTGTGDSSSANEIYFADNGQIRSADNNHRIIFDRQNQIMEFREYGDLLFSPGSSNGVGFGRTEKMVIKSSGYVGIGTTSPQDKLHIDPSGAGGISIGTNPGSGGYTYLSMDISAQSGGYSTIQSIQSAGSAWGLLSLNASGGNVSIGSTTSYDKLSVAGNVSPTADNSYTCGVSGRRWSYLYAANGTVQTSDIRLKDSIKNLSYGLTEVMAFHPVSYFWKKNPEQGKKVGLIAQEVQKIVPEVVKVGDDSMKTLGMNYAELVPVLINAIQEQQKIIETQKASLSEQKASIENQDARLDKLEAMLKSLQPANIVSIK